MDDPRARRQSSVTGTRFQLLRRSTRRGPSGGAIRPEAQQNPNPPDPVPELPEVETIVRDLQRLVTGARILSASVARPDLIEGGSASDFEAALPGALIEEIGRRAKNIVMRLSGVATEAERLIINLGMTGGVLVLEEGASDPPYTGVRMPLEDGRRMIYQDARRFGRLELLSAAAWERRSEQLGLEPLSPAFTVDALHKLTRSSRVAAKTWLMDQRRVVGVGNIYASESLFRARVNPRKAARRLLRRETQRLHDAVREVLQEAIDFRGTTLLDYRDAAGERGAFSRKLRVYDRAGEACIDCGTMIRRIVQGGRSTFYCPTCQK